MGPLVPDLIGNELNYIVAIIIGFGFGFILEQAGFSTSKKLVGLFYGYDFTVLRVFFTAGVTAMFGVVVLDHFGLLDMSLILVNPTFIWSAIVGGLIMGLGFIIGGYCPGTSICGAAIGKIDGMLFLAGSFAGVFLFAEGYPWFEGLYKAANLGNIRIFETLGMSQSLFACLLILAAAGTFWGVTFIEKKINGKPNPDLKPGRLYIGITVVVVFIAFSALLLPDRKESLLKETADSGFVASYPVAVISADELAFRLIDKDPSIQIFDLRNRKDFDSLGLPGSTRIEMTSLFDKSIGKLLSVNHKKNIFIADKEQDAKKAAVLASELGYKEISVLAGGMENFIKDILNFKMPEGNIDRKNEDTYKFRAEAGAALPKLIKEYKLKQVPEEKKGNKRKLVGC